ncbi:ATP-binding protein [Pontibacter sp. G13]|uniref:ATP-binding protein n=1 Tax=Pontibacter sp. G13 TaxID=3074898 RepID=UPI00288B28CC|nr:ATP-binding protein [Pontibacter sp. G13]WNJ15917.1 ATP-binding protein [Pontibacter sp. G13]
MNSRTDTKVLTRKLELDSNSDAIHTVEAVIDELRSVLEFKEDVYGNVMVAVTEAVNNSIIHGNKEDESKKVIVEITAKSHYSLKVSVSDEGEGFDPSNLADPTSPENLENIGGRGVFLMEHLSDSMSFTNDGKTVEMTFNI